jgi:hypothetical protein
MSENITKEFVFTAPNDDFNVEGTTYREISTTYRGADTIWIYVDINTGKNPQFMSEGDLPDPTNTWRHRSVLLTADNPNHVLLMDLLSTSRGHTNNTEYNEQLNQIGDISGAPNYMFSFSDFEEPSAVRYYDIKETHVDENGVVTYAYFPPIDLDRYKEFIKSIIFNKIQQTEEKLKDPVVLEIPSAIDRCNRYISILKYADEILLETTKPWKVIVPDIHEV